MPNEISEGQHAAGDRHQEHQYQHRLPGQPERERGDQLDVAALALWLPWKAVLVLVFLMSVAGGVLTLAYLIRHKLAKREEKLEIPYGVAIAFGGLWLISERFLNQFG